ncbi:hypothetical protein L1887_26444 [Cichorium endivia]|nr:hypothetical protein L1887_26444 [Cichorium endivia]
MVTPKLKPRSSEEAQTKLNFISLSQTGRIRGPGLRDSRIIFCKSKFDFSQKSSDPCSISVLVVDIQWPPSSHKVAIVSHGRRRLIFYVKTLAVVSQHHSLPIFWDLRFANRIHTTDIDGLRLHTSFKIFQEEFSKTTFQSQMASIQFVKLGMGASRTCTDIGDV